MLKWEEPFHIISNNNVEMCFKYAITTQSFYQYFLSMMIFMQLTMFTFHWLIENGLRLRTW